MEYFSGTAVPDLPRAKKITGRRRTSPLLRWFVFVLAFIAACAARATTFTSDSVTVVANLNAYSEMLTPTGSGWIWSLRPYTGVYPSNQQNMQFIAFRKSTGEILYVQTQDSSGGYMKWEVVNSGGTYQLKLTTQTSTGSFPVAYITDTSMTAATQTEFYRKVARKYKAWAVNQEWASRKFSPMDKASAMINVQNLQDSTRTQVSNYLSDWAGQNTLCYITFWRKYWQLHLDGGVPDYRINADDSPGSTYTTAWASANVQKYDQLLNCQPFGYTNPLLWDSRIKEYSSPTPDTDDYFLNEINTNVADANYEDHERWMVRDDGDNVLTYTGGTTTTHRKFVCPAVSAYRTLFVDKMSLMSSYNFKGLYADQIAFEAPKLCYDTSHGHDAGSPTAYQNGLRQMLIQLKTDTGMMVFTEGSAEIYMNLVDAYLMWDGTATEDVPGKKQVPLYREVYGEFTRWIGWQLTDNASNQTVPNDTELLAAIRKADNFGYMFHGQPYMFGTSTNENPRIQMTPTGSGDPYQDVREAIAAAPYKQLYERGSGAVNWVAENGIADAANVVDSETGTAAISIDVGEGAGYYWLPIDETGKFQLSWDMKLNSGADTWIAVEVTTAEQENPVILYYDNHARSYQSASTDFGGFGLGSDVANGNWHSFERDLVADLQVVSTATSTPLTLVKVNKFLAFSKGQLDNIALSNTPAQVLEDGASASDWGAGCSLSGCTTTGLNASSVLDTETGANVISFTGISGRDDGKWFRRMINDDGNFEVSWDLKASTPYYVMFTVEAEDGTQYNLLYDKSARDYRETVGITVKLGLGADTYDGQWHTFRRNLADDLYEGTGKSIVSVVSMRVFSTCSVSNVKLWGNGKLRSSGY